MACLTAAAVLLALAGCRSQPATALPGAESADSVAETYYPPSRAFRLELRPDGSVHEFIAQHHEGEAAVSPNLPVRAQDLDVPYLPDPGEIQMRRSWKIGGTMLVITAENSFSRLHTEYTGMASISYDQDGRAQLTDMNAPQSNWLPGLTLTKP